MCPRFRKIQQNPTLGLNLEIETRKHDRSILVQARNLKPENIRRSIQVRARSSKPGSRGSQFRVELVTRNLGTRGWWPIYLRSRNLWTRTNPGQNQVTPPTGFFKIHNLFILSPMDFKFHGYTLLWVTFMYNWFHFNWRLLTQNMAHGVITVQSCSVSCVVFMKIFKFLACSFH